MKKTLFLLLIFIGLINCRSTSEKKGDPIDNFWTWFSQNESQFRDLKDTNEISAEIKKINERLVLIFEPSKKGVINMTISAGGDTTLFSKVKETVAKAPKINGWNFIAFRQRISPDKVRKMLWMPGKDKQILYPVEMKFFPIISGNSLDINLYATNLTDENRNDVSLLCLILTDSILGEYDFAKKVNDYRVQSMPTDIKELSQLLPFLDIAKYIDNIPKLFPPIEIKKWNKTPAVSGRLATKKEATDGTALFYLNYWEEKDKATPYNVALPKLAYVKPSNNLFTPSDNEKEELVVVIQIVQTINDTLVGYRPIVGGNGGTYFRNVRFLNDNEVKTLVGN